jgi:hypothetical protein
MTLINRHRTGLPLGVVCLRAISEPSDVSAIPSATAQAGTYLIVKTNSSTKQEYSDCNVGLSENDRGSRGRVGSHDCNERQQLGGDYMAARQMFGRCVS